MLEVELQHLYRMSQLGLFKIIFIEYFWRSLVLCHSTKILKLTPVIRVSLRLEQDIKKSTTAQCYTMLLVYVQEFEGFRGFFMNRFHSNPSNDHLITGIR